MNQNKENLSQLLERICHEFAIPGTFLGFEEMKNGNVHHTYRVFFREEGGKEMSYLLQEVNTYAFRKPIEVMQNIDRITRHVKEKSPESMVMNYHHSGENAWFMDETGFWRLCDFIESITYNTCEDLQIVKNAGQAFGQFQMHLSDFDPSILFYSIPNFHNTRSRYADLKAAAKENYKDRLSQCREDLEYLLSVEDLACTLTDLYDQGKMPLRVTHNDTKINNVLFDKETHDALVVIDLDTVMPGLMGHDFGDAIRFAANTVAEDCPDPSQVEINMDVFRAFTEGFLSETAGILTPAEKETLALSSFVLAAELATRFLGDYLIGDPYFVTRYEDHNLVRARCQIALAKKLLERREEMQQFIDEFLAGK